MHMLSVLSDNYVGFIFIGVFVYIYIHKLSQFPLKVKSSAFCQQSDECLINFFWKLTWDFSRGRRKKRNVNIIKYYILHIWLSKNVF